MGKHKVTSCHLICLQNTHDAIDLPHDIPVVVGRSPQTTITEVRCSRHQVELVADWSSKKVRVKHLGGNPSSIDGKDVKKNEIVTIGTESTLFLLSGLYPHKVVFEEYKKDDKDKKDEKQRTDLKGQTENGKGNQNRRESGHHSGSSKRKHESSDTEEVKDKTKPFHRKHENADKPSSKHDKSNQHENECSDRKKRKKEDSESRRKSFDRNKETASGHLPRRSDEPERDEEEVHLKDVHKKLQQMKEAALKNDKSKSSDKNSSREIKNLSRTPSKDSPSSSGHEKSSSSSSTEPQEKSKWDDYDQYHVYTHKGVVPRKKIASFDLDGTIIVTQSGKTFPVDSTDWKIIFPDVFGKLKKLFADKYKIVFFTNQLGVSRGKVKIEELKTKVEFVVAKLQVPVQVFIATHEGRYRKPMDGLWQELKEKYNGNLAIDLKESIYVGDAAGRPVNWAPKKKKDFSASDRLFALNVGVPFKTPEEFFLNHKSAPYIMPAFDPRELRETADLISPDKQLTSDTKEVIVLVGLPASGKSHFAQHILNPKGYVVINRDKLGSWQKCVQKTKESLVTSSVVIDNTNLSKEERARYLECASKANVHCRCFVFTTTVDHCRHNERFRQMTDKSHAKINEMLFNHTKNKFQEPSMTEGFTEIVNVNFVPSFISRSAASTYRKFLLEK